MVVKKKQVECAHCGSILEYDRYDVRRTIEEKKAYHRRGENGPSEPCTDYKETWTIMCPVCRKLVIVEKKYRTEFD